MPGESPPLVMTPILRRLGGAGTPLCTANLSETVGMLRCDMAIRRAVPVAFRLSQASMPHVKDGVYAVYVGSREREKTRLKGCQ